MNIQHTALWSCAFALATVPLSTAQTVPSWEDDFHVGGYDFPTAIGTDAQGNIFVAGPSAGGFGLLLKYAPDGTQLWTRTFDGNYDGAADDMVVDPQGNVTIAGQRTASPGDYPYHVTRFDPDGNPLWTAEYDRLLSPSNPHEYRAGLALDSQGNAILVGAIGTNQLYPSTQDWFVVKFGEPVAFNAATGRNEPTLLWEDVFDGSPSAVDKAKHVVVDAVDDVYVTGTTSPDYPDPGALVTRKYQGNDGQVLWTDSYPVHNFGTLMHSAFFGPDLVFDTSGALIVTGTTLDGVVTRKLDPTTGTTIWTRHHNTGSPQEGAVIRALPNGGVAIAGTSYDAGTGVSGYAAVRYDTDGNLGWARRVAISEAPYWLLVPMAVTRSGNVVLGGDAFVASPEDYDLFVTMLDGDTGNILWSYQQGGAALEWDWTGALAVDAWDNVIAAAGVVTDANLYLGQIRTMKFGNAQPGADVEVTPDADATLTFDQVLAPLEVGVTYTQDPPEPLPAGFELGGAGAGGTPTYIDITAEPGSAFTGSVQLAFQYDDSLFADENAIQLLHYEGGEWVDITTSVDTVNNVVYGVTTSFSPFAIVQAPRTVRIDIKPGSEPNSINLGSNGVVPVAILGSPELDVREIDPLTVQLANATVRLRGNGTPQASIQDVDQDGHDDLVVQVITDALELTATDVEAVLLGWIPGQGTWIRGVDSIRIVP